MARAGADDGGSRPSGAGNRSGSTVASGARGVLAQPPASTELPLCVPCAQQQKASAASRAHACALSLSHASLLCAGPAGNGLGPAGNGSTSDSRPGGGATRFPTGGGGAGSSGGGGASNGAGGEGGEGKGRGSGGGGGGGVRGFLQAATTVGLFYAFLSGIGFLVNGGK